MDTGSTGMIISAWELGYRHPSELSHYAYGSHFLSSSKIFYTGYWVPVKLAFLDSDVASDVSVFAVVSTGTCLDFDAEKGVCQELINRKDMPASIAYLGVGFGRYGPEQPGSTSDKNPLINITCTGGSTISKEKISQGYVITEKGVHVGLTPELRCGFHVLKLNQNRHQAVTSKDVAEWSGIPMSLHLSEQFANIAGTILFDSGISQMYLGIPKDAYNSLKLRKVGSSTRVKDGSHFTVRIGQKESTPILEWPVVVGSPEVTTPKKVLPRGKKPGMAFINSGRNFFKRHDLLFDAEKGLVGLRQRSAVSGRDIDASGRAPIEKL